MRLRDQRGFSMTELAVILAIVGILAALGVPSFVKIMPRVRLAGAATTLANEIAGLRMAAIAKSVDFRILFDPANDRYTFQKWNGASFVTYAASTMKGTDLVSAGGFDPDPPGDILVVYGYGGASVQLGSKAVVKLQTPNGDRKKRILVEATGRTVVEKWQGGDDTDNANWFPE